MPSRILALSVAAVLVLIPTVAWTQQQPPGRGPGQGPGPGGPPGAFDPAQFREGMLKFWQNQLEASDEEWKVLTPKLEKVWNAQRDARGGFFGFFGGRPGGPGGPGGPGRPGGFGGPGGDQEETRVARAQRELRTLLDNKDAPSAEITKKLAAYREARDKARADLEAAQKELRELVTPRQEAVLVMASMLE